MLRYARHAKKINMKGLLEWVQYTVSKMEMCFSPGGLSNLRDKHAYVIYSQTSQTVTLGVHFLRTEFIQKDIKHSLYV